MNPDKQASQQIQNDFSNVDRSGQAYHYVQYLEKQRNDADLQEIKQQSYALLEVTSGKYLLDVGCGLGDDVRSLATFVGSKGKVIGVDNSLTLLEFAKQSEGPLEYCLGDAHNLPFHDATFDGCRAERLLQNCHTPEIVL